MKVQNPASLIALLSGIIVVISFCTAGALKKLPQKKVSQRHVAVAKTVRLQAKPATHSLTTQGGNITVRSMVIQPYDANRIARDNKYEQLLEEGDKTVAANPVLAEGYYQKAASLIAYRPDAWLGLARARDAQGKSTQAFPAYRQAFNPPSGSGLYSSFPSDVASFARYGALCVENGQQEEAMKVYTQAGDRLNPKPDVPFGVADLSPQNLRARLDMIRGIALAEAKEHSGQDRDKEALQAFQKAAQEQPNDPHVQFYLGYGLRKAGKFAQAQTAFQKAAALDTEGTVKGATEENLRAVQAHRR